MTDGLAPSSVPPLIARDRGLLWHPYAPLDGPAPHAVRDADGVVLHLDGPDGRRWEAIDGMSSWWCAVHGHGHPVLDAALHGQVDRFSHVMFGGLTHEPAVELAEELVRITPDPLRHVFLADSGSVSMEVALKLSVQYQAARGRTGRSRFVALRGAYHGDTVAAMSVCDPVDGMHALFPQLVPEQVFLPRPPAATLVDGRVDATGDRPDVDAWVVEAEEVVARHADELAAIVVEPVLQGAGGMYAYDPRCLAALRRLADEHGLLLVADEIATGFGRTGMLFGCAWADVVPDVMCVGKALTGGTMTLAALLCTGEVADVITDSPQRALMHGPTFMGNPLACAVARASLGLLDGRWSQQVAEVSAALGASLAPAADLSVVRDVRVLGAIGAVELDEPVDVGAVTRVALEHGVWLRPFRNLVYTMPPYVSTPEQVATIGRAMVAAVRDVHEPS
jgi:adenosylmethionine-8-amino-7-oxononanoate aminotransferase